MPLLEGGILALIRTISYFLDVFTYIPYYLYQQQGKRLWAARAHKAIRQADNSWRLASEPVLTTTPSADCHTIPELFEKAVIQYRDQQCVGTREFFKEEDEVQPNGKVFKKSILGNYEWKTYGQVFDEVKWLGRGLGASGMRPGSNILIFAETRADWMISAHACFRQNFSVVTLYATLGDEAVIHGINETECTHVITSGDLLPKFKKILAQTPAVRHITYMKGRTQVNPSAIGDGHKVTIVGMEEVIEQGKAQGDQYVDTMPLPTDMAVIMYTSGSTGLPKGVCLSHSNVMAAISGLCDRIQPEPGESYIGYLPLAHILELCAELTCLYCGVMIGYSSPNTLSDASTAIKKGQKGDASVLRPVYMACVPTVMDRIYKNVWDKVESGGLLKRILFKFAVSYKKKWISWGGDTPIINRAIMSSVTGLLGGRVKGMLSGGAPLNPETQEFIRVSMCAPVLQGYALTETCCGGCVCTFDDLDVGHVGPPVSCVRVKLVDWEEGGYMSTDNPPRGEVLIGGPAVAIGYYKNDEKTYEDFFQDGDMRWFKTGDIGEMTPSGNLKIIDRKKDLVKLQAGEYVSLGKVEACLKLCPLVDNICVFASSMQNYVVAVIVPNPKALQDLADSMNIPGDWKEICSNAELTKRVLKEVQKQAAGSLQKFEIPQRLVVTDEVWTPDTGLVTDSLKLKRKPLTDFYREDVQKMYR